MNIIKKEVLRKCKICDKERMEKTINLNEDKYIYYRGGYYHYDCFLEHVFQNNKKGLSEKDIIAYVDEKLLNTIQSKTVKESVDKDKLTYWIYDNYNVTTLSKQFFTKLTGINRGDYSSNVTVPISYHDLLQIFIKMKPYLDKTYKINEKNGKHFTTQGRINYDLAIVINNYDDYLKWRQKQKAKNTENEQLQEEIKKKSSMNTENIIKNKREEEDELNISELLDELF